MRVQPKPQNRVRVALFLPAATGGWYNAGGLQMSELVWRVLVYPLLSAGATRRGVTLTVETP